MRLWYWPRVVIRSKVLILPPLMNEYKHATRGNRANFGKHWLWSISDPRAGHNQPRSHLHTGADYTLHFLLTEQVSWLALEVGTKVKLASGQKFRASIVSATLKLILFTKIGKFSYVLVRKIVLERNYWAD